MRHILFTLKECNVDLIEDTEYVRDCLYQAAKECNSTLLNLNIHKFQPQGLTGIVMLAESHISIHTWPEKCMAVCDIFTCGQHTTPMRGVEYLQERFKSSDMTINEFIRPLD